VNKRRKLIIALGTGTFASPLGLFAQPPAKTYRIGFLSSESAPGYRTRVEALRAGLRGLGYEEGKNLTIEFRWAEGKADRLPDLAAELVRLNVDLIVTHGAIPLRAANNATTTIPIVFAASGDVIAMGFVASLARPGGNMTGSIFFASELSTKRIELLKEALPRIVQAGVLSNPDSPASRQTVQAMQTVARSWKVTLHEFPMRNPQDFDSAFATMAKQRIGAIVIHDDPMFLVNAAAFAVLAATRKLPSIGSAEIVEAGGLMGYGADILGLYRRAAYYVDKIIKGAKPGDIPIEQASRFELIVNLKTARALGIEIPHSILVRADRVIE
jgi:putative ABC transport system substrate-binding protein